MKMLVWVIALLVAVLYIIHKLNVQREPINPAQQEAVNKLLQCPAGWHAARALGVGPWTCIPDGSRS